MDRIVADNSIVDSSGKRKFRDGYLPATIMTAEFLNSIQEEIVGGIEAAGLYPSPTDNSQLVQAFRRRVRWAVDEDTGASNEYILNPIPAITEYEEGFVIRFLAMKESEIVSYVNLNSLGNREIKIGGDNIGAGVIQSGRVIRLVYVAGGWFEYLHSGGDIYG